MQIQLKIKGVIFNYPNGKARLILGFVTFVGLDILTFFKHKRVYYVIIWKLEKELLLLFTMC